MRVNYIVYEDFVNYKKPSMFIGTISCNGKCCIESGVPLSVCQNDALRSREPIVMDDNKLCESYLKNKLTSAVVFGGLEPFEQFSEVYNFIYTFRNKFKCEDDVVIYTGYYPEEIEEELSALKQFKNMVVKFGRYIPNQKYVYDEVLGVELASDNQYGVRL